MNKVDFVKAMKILGIAYNKEFTEEQVGVWYEFFKDVNIESFKTAIQRIVVKNKYLPSIAELKQEITYINNPILQLNIDEEWEQVIKVIRKYGYYRSEEALKSLNEYTRNIVQTIGWYRLCTSENIEWERRTFKELFNNKQDGYESALLISEPQLTLAELTRLAQTKSNEQLLLESSNE